MSQIRLIVPAGMTLPATVSRMAYFAGWEGIPWRARIAVSERLVSVVHAFEESGALYLPWPTTSGTLVLPTALLRQQETPYRLDIELARGTVHRVRQFIAQSELAGCPIPPAFHAALEEAQGRFLDAIACASTDEARSVAAASAAIDICVQQIPDLVGRVVQFALDGRRRHSPQLPTILAGRLEEVPTSKEQEQQFLSTYNVAVVSVPWRHVQAESGKWHWETLDRQLNWCSQKGIRVGAGPLLTADRHQLPEWLFLWDDFEGICSAVAEFLQATVRHCRGKVQYWHVAAGLNLPGDLDLDEENRLRLIAVAVETVRKVDSQTPIIVTFAQPWGEYLATSSFDLAPLHFADTLIRAELGISGVGLELNLGYLPGGSPPRDLLQVADQLDRWANLNVPLLVTLTIPSATSDDALAWDKDVKVDWPAEEVSPQTQCRWFEQLLPLLLAQPSVHGILVNQGRDAVPHSLPHGGLWDHKDRPKPALAVVQQLRQRWLS